MTVEGQDLGAWDREEREREGGREGERERAREKESERDRERARARERERASEREREYPLVNSGCNLAHTVNEISGASIWRLTPPRV